MSKIQKVLEDLNLEESNFISFNKGTLKKLIQKGDFLGKVDSNYTDDYAYDAETNYGKTDWMPVKISDDNNHDFGNIKDGIMYIGVDYFGDKYVRASVTQDEPNIIGLSLHTFKHLSLKDKKGTKFFELPDVSGHDKLSPEELFCLVITYNTVSSYRGKYYSKLPNYKMYLDSLVKKGFISKSGAISKTGKSYLLSDKDNLRKELNDFVDSKDFRYSVNTSF